MRSTGSPDEAGGRELLLMALLAIALRVALYAVATGLTRTGFADYAAAADGYQWGGENNMEDINQEKG